MKKPHPNHHTYQSEKKTKADRIRHLKKNNPELTAYEIAKMVHTSESYVYNVLSKAKQRDEVKRRREKRLYAVTHGSMFYRNMILSEWYEDLDAPIVNGITGMKQVGFKRNGDPCSCQIHKNGRVMVFPHSISWEEWLSTALTKCGWDFERSSLLVDNLVLQVNVVEGGVRVPDGHLPEVFRLKSEWGLEVVRDNSPTKNMLELKLRVPDLKHYLGLPEFEKKLDLMSKGTMTTHQLLRVAIALLINERGRYSEESAEKA